MSEAERIIVQAAANLLRNHGHGTTYAELQARHAADEIDYFLRCEMYEVDAPEPQSLRA